MSASRERKKRVEQSSIVQPETTKKTKKISEGWIFAICMILVSALLLGGLFIRSYKRTHQTVLTVGDYDVEVCEFNYFYRELAATFESYASYIGIDTTVALDEQKIETGDTTYLGMFGLDTTCLEGLTDSEGVYDFTWAELFADNAMRNAASAYAVYQEAEKAGYELDADTLADIDGVIEDVKGYAVQYNMSTDDYIEAVFGKGCDEESYRQYMKVVQTASSYPSTIEYTDAEVEARDAQNPEDFDTVAFYYYTTNATAMKDAAEAETETETVPETEGETEGEAETVSDTETETETETDTETETETDTEGEVEEEVEEELTPEELAALDQQAKEAAEKMAADFDVNADDVTIYADYTREILDQMKDSSMLTEEAVEWLCKDGAEGAVKMFTIEPEAVEAEEGEEAEAETAENTYVVIKILDRKDYNTANFLSITIEDDAEETEETETTEETEETEPAAVRVEKIKAALEADPSEESFRALILENLDHDHEEGEEHDHEDEGLSENQSRYSMASVSKDVFNWMMLEERKAGDWQMFDLDGKTVFYFYLGEGENYRELSIKTTILNEWYKELTEAAIANCGYDKKAAMKGEVGYFA